MTLFDFLNIFLQDTKGLHDLFTATKQLVSAALTNMKSKEDWMNIRRAVTLWTENAGFGLLLFSPKSV